MGNMCLCSSFVQEIGGLFDNIPKHEQKVKHYLITVSIILKIIPIYMVLFICSRNWYIL
jgi:hypothetical protein